MGANLKEVRERIQSVDSTMQITKAMKMVSAAKLRRAQEAINRLRPYSNKLDSILSNVVTAVGEDASLSLGVVRPIEKACLIVVTSNRGLCGAFNTNILKAAEQRIKERYSELVRTKELAIAPVGKKAYDYFRKKYPYLHVDKGYINMFDDLSFDNASRLPKRLIGSFERGRFDAIDIVYSRFKNAALQFATVEEFLPIPKMDLAESESSVRADYIFEPSMDVLLEELAPTILLTKFQKCVLDTNASEHGARMTAMDNATNNAEELKRDLKIAYNKARQEAITKEISEIVGGAAALNG